MTGTGQASGLDVETTREVLADLLAERYAQHAIWGDQSRLPDGTGGEARAARADRARADCQAAGDGLTFRHLVEEEICEAYAETEPEALCGELRQAGALIVQWMAAIRRRAAVGGPAAGTGAHQ
ncbi:hypothetical protein [Longispora albida]|uniref:hypothetical protein n=1 Tax=Longispora albida TaxID=203523 RepID=UPI00039BE677|nr:hypothetical protein [Longispora albida]